LIALSDFFKCTQFSVLNFQFSIKSTTFAADFGNSTF